MQGGGANPIALNVARAMRQAEAAYGGGDAATAERLCRLVLGAHPDCFDALSLLGILTATTRRLAESGELLARAVAVQPGNAAAHNNRGVVLKDLRRFDQALDSYQRALELKPDFAAAHNNRGNVLIELRRFEEALCCYDRALQINADYADAYCNRGNALQALKRFDAAIASYERALQIRPDFPEAYCNRAASLKDLRQFDAALASYERAIALRPGFGEAQHNRAMLLLLRGDFENGWPAYEWRWKDPSSSNFRERRQLAPPLWLGDSDIAGKSVLIYCEQGVGDTIQFCRYVNLVAKLQGKVILMVSPSLRGLLSSLQGVYQLVSSGSTAPDCDFQCPLMSLPLAFKTELATIPTAGRYLSGDAASLRRWQARLGDRTKPRVGLAWSGNPAHKNDHHRSLPLADLMRRLPAGIQYVALQRDVRAGDRCELHSNASIMDVSEELGDLADNAALCECMDLVISVDTSVAHLSAALGKTTWILLSANADWRWLLDRDDSPWYPTVRLYRQTILGDWSSVIDRVKSDLSGALNAAATPTA
jgi:tetratricopeptide (TPR) repeat protein